MKTDGLNVLGLMFRENEWISVSNSQYGYASVPIKTAISDSVPLVSPNYDIATQYINSDDLIFVAINPIKRQAFRRDSECSAFRNFLIEIDEFSQSQQLDYIKNLRVPISSITWSGNRSIHVLIALEEDLPSENAYRILYKWILNIVTLADQNLGNPSRSIRLAGATRPETGQEQKLLEIKGRVKLEDLVSWLKQYPEAKPKPVERKLPVDNYDYSHIPPWTKKLLKQGLSPHKGRNVQWFGIGADLCAAGIPLDEAIDILREFFTPERDFKEKEWLTAINSGYKVVNSRKE